MKKLLLFSIALIVICCANAQSKNTYAELISYDTGKTLSTCNVLIDAGIGKVGQICVDDKIIEFNTIMDAVNFMAGHGWKVVNAYSSEFNGNFVGLGREFSPIAIHYILAKEITDNSQICEGFTILSEKEIKAKEREARRDRNSKVKDDLYAH